MYNPDSNDLETLTDGAIEKTLPSVSAVFQNYAILAKILTYIRPNLQEYRLINKNCNDVVLRLLHKRVKLSFNFEPRSYLSRRPHFEAQVVRVQNLNIQNFCVMLSSRKLPKEAVSDIGWFMKNFGKKMKSLDLTFWLINQSSYSMLSRIFKHLSSLEEMIVKLTIAKDNVQDVNKWPAPLGSVRRIGFKTVDSSSGFLEPQLVINLMKLYPNMESLTIFPPTFSYHALKYIADCQQFLKLNEINLWLDNVSVDNTLNILAQLARIHINARILCLECFPPLDHTMSTALEKVLLRHGPTLRSLKLETLSVKMDNFDERCILRLPTFPLLKRLKLILGYYTESGGAVRHLILKFPSERISYKNDFPMLEDLHICADFMDVNHSTMPFPGNVADIFLPTEPPITKCLRMKRAELNDFPEEWMHPGNLKWMSKFVDNFQNVFPNASLMPMEKLITWIKAQDGNLQT